MEGIQYGIQQGYNPMTAAAYASQPYASQFGQQSLFGGAANPLSGLMGSGIPGLWSGQNVGRQPGQGVDSFGGMFQPYGNPYANPYGNIDPMTAAHLQQAQLGQQGQFGQQGQLGPQAHLAQLAQQAQLAQLVQQAQVAQQLAQQQLGRSPYGLDPISAAIAQQRAQFGQQPQFGQHVGQQPQLAPWLGVNPLNRVDPITAAYIQQAQIAQLFQQLALQGQLGQPGQFGQQFGQGPGQQFGSGQGQQFGPGQGQQFGQGPGQQFGQGPGQGWFGGGQNPWANPHLATQYGRTQPLPYGGQLPLY
jgi:hypothetical protein